MNICLPRQADMFNEGKTALANLTRDIQRAEEQVALRRTKVEEDKARILIVIPGSCAQRTAEWQSEYDASMQVVEQAKLDELLACRAQIRMKMAMRKQFAVLNTRGQIELHDAFEHAMEAIPSSLHRFEPQPLESTRPQASGMRAAGVLGRMDDASRPDFLLTEMFATTTNSSLDASSKQDFASVLYSSMGGEELKETRHCAKLGDLPTRVHVLVGASGTGKTLYACRTARNQPTLLFACNKGGEMQWIISEARRRAQHQCCSAGSIMRFAQREMRKAVAIRLAVYQACVIKFGGSGVFTAAHWGLAQMFPQHVFGRDLFAELQSLKLDKEDVAMALLPMSLGTGIGQHVRRLVLDEAECAEALLLGSLPNGNDLLALFSQTLAGLTATKLLVCGTKVSNLHSQERVFALCTHFTEEGVLAALTRWGLEMSLSSSAWLRAFCGRPRHATMLANALLQGDVREEYHCAFGAHMDAVNQARDVVFHSEAKGGFRVSVVTLLDVIMDAALDRVLGRGGFGALTRGTALAIKQGLAAFKRNGTGKLVCVVDEPLVLETILFARKLPLTCSLSTPARLRELIAFRMQGIVHELAQALQCERRARKVPSSLQRDWQFGAVVNMFQWELLACINAGKHCQVLSTNRVAEELGWLGSQLRFPSNTVCLAANGNLVLACAHAREDPFARLLLVISIDAMQQQVSPAVSNLLHAGCYQIHLTVNSNTVSLQFGGGSGKDFILKCSRRREFKSLQW